MWQEIAIILIGIATVAYVAWKVYEAAAASRRGETTCPGCNQCAPSKKKPVVKKGKNCCS